MKTLTALFIGFSVLATPVLAGPLLDHGQRVTAKFTSGNLKGKTFRLRYSEKTNMLKDRPVTEHTANLIAIKTPGGWCKFYATAKVECHNGAGTWKVK